MIREHPSQEVINRLQELIDVIEDNRGMREIEIEDYDFD